MPSRPLSADRSAVHPLTRSILQGVPSRRPRPVRRSGPWRRRRQGGLASRDPIARVDSPACRVPPRSGRSEVVRAVLAASTTGAAPFFSGVAQPVVGAALGSSRGASRRRTAGRRAAGGAGPSGLGVPVRPESMAWLDELGRAVQLDPGAGGTAGAGGGPAGLTLTLARKPDGGRRPRRCGSCRRTRGASSGRVTIHAWTARTIKAGAPADALCLWLLGRRDRRARAAAVLVPGGVIGEDDHRPQRLRGGPARHPPWSERADPNPRVASLGSAWQTSNMRSSLLLDIVRPVADHVAAGYFPADDGDS